MNRDTRLAMAGLLLCAAAMPGLRPWLEADMARHMLLQFPLVIASGFWMAGLLPMRMQSVVARFNVAGISGLVLALLVASLWMVPRALDEAVRAWPVEAAKIASLWLAGAALQLSWKRAGPVVQLFFLGNWAWMTATIGMVYMESPLRLCNVYLVDDQRTTGMGLMAAALLLPLLWLCQPKLWRLLLSDAPRAPTRPSV